MKKVIAAATTLVVSVALMLVGVAPASADYAPSNVSSATLVGGVAACQSDGTYTVTWTYSQALSPLSTQLNTAATKSTVTVSATSPTGTLFDGSSAPKVLSGTGAWITTFVQSRIPGSTKSVTISALANYVTPGASYNPTYTVPGQITLGGDCTPPTPNSGTPSVSTTPPSCTSAATLVLSAADHFSWGPVTTTAVGQTVTAAFVHVTAAPVTTAGVNYSVTAIAASGYLLPNGLATQTFTGTLAPELAGTDCDVVLPSASFVTGVCYANGTSSSEHLSFVFDNTKSNMAVEFSVPKASPAIDVWVPAGQKEAVETSPMRDSGGSYDVYMNGSPTALTLVIPAFTGCLTATPGDPHVTPQLCVSGSYAGGSITVVDVTGLVYTVVGPDGAKVPLVGNKALNLSPGNYVVSATAQTGYVLSGDSKWPLTVSIDPYVGDCLPTLPVWDAGATGSPAVCLPAGPFGSITLTHAIGENGKVDYKILNVATQVSTEVGSTVTTVQEPAGDYVVTATPTVKGDGISGGTNVFPVTVAEYDGDCLPTLAGFDAGATFAPATCRGSDGTSGTITFVTTPGEVDYTITNLATQVTTDLGTTTSSLKVAAGSYSIAAKVVHTGDTIFEFNAASGTLPTIMVAAVTTICSTLHTLAYTGVTSPGLGFGLAAAMLILGLAGLFVRRRYGRSAK
ncbi:MAG TPA: hypothetical protein VIJ76_07835 [Galbitalea sp.]